jgi:hypothetical protein
MNNFIYCDKKFSLKFSFLNDINNNNLFKLNRNLIFLIIKKSFHLLSKVKS